jgi:hypothetical protein
MHCEHAGLVLSHFYKLVETLTLGTIARAFESFLNGHLCFPSDTGRTSFRPRLDNYYCSLSHDELNGVCPDKCFDNQALRLTTIE